MDEKLSGSYYTPKKLFTLYTITYNSNISL